MKTHSIFISAIMLTVLAVSLASAEIRYDVIDLGSLAGNWSTANAINNEGQIVGACYDGSGYFRAVLFDPTGGGNNIDLGDGVAFSINDNGQIVGNSGYYPWQATIFDPTGGGENIYLDDWSDAQSINNSGQIVGVLEIQATLFDPTGAGNHIFMGEGTAYSINDLGQIVGHSLWPVHATLFDPTGGGVNIELDTAMSSASAINNSGQIVGNTWDYSGDPHYPQGLAHATLFDITGQGNNLDLGTLDDLDSYAWSINNKGQIVGECGEPIGANSYATLFDGTGGGNNINLNDLIDPNLGWTLNYTSCINDNGWIVGAGYNAAGHLHAYLLIPIPTAIEAEIDIDPSMLNLQSKGKWITCHIRLSEGCNVADIDPNSVLLEEEIPADWVGLQGQSAMAKFSRSGLREMIAGLETPTQIELLVTGELTDGTGFEGTDTIRIIDKGSKK